MNATFDKEDSGQSDVEDVDMPVKKLDYEDGDSEDSEEAGEHASLPTESASLGGPSSKRRAKTSTGTKSSSQKKPSFIDMIVEAIQEIGDKKGATVPALKTYLRETHGVTEVVMKTNLKKAIAKGEENDVLIRPNASKDSKGLTGRFKVSPEYIKAKQKKEKMKEKQKKKSEATNKPRKKKAPAAAVNRKDLKSLQEKSLAVKLAKEKIKQARKSIGLTPNTKPKAAPKKRAKPPAKKSTASKSPKIAVKKKPKPKTAKTTKGTTKESSGKTTKKATTAKKTTKAK